MKRTKAKIHKPFLIDEGLYFFGGKNQKGEVQGKLKFAQMKMEKGKITSCELFRVKQTGKQPEPRYSHKMCFLRCTNAILIAGGRND